MIRFGFITHIHIYFVVLPVIIVGLLQDCRNIHYILFSDKREFVIIRYFSTMNDK